MYSSWVSNNLPMIILLFIIINSYWLEATDGVVTGNIIYGDNGRIRGINNRINKDFVLGAVLPIHHLTEEGRCTEDVFAEAVDFVDALLYSIELVNNDSNILSNLTLGYDIRDSCLMASTTIEEGVDLVLLSNPENFLTCTQTDVNTATRVSAIIGEYVSSVSIPLANFLQPFDILQISFSATSVVLNNRQEYSNFYRTIPSDDQQALALIDLVLYFGWTHVSTIHSNDEYGEPGIDAFMNLANKNQVCVDLDIGINSDSTEAQYIDIVKRIYNSTANAIIFFSSLQQVKGLFQHFHEYSMKLKSSLSKRKFLWVASDAWVESPEVHLLYSDIVAGMWGTIPASNTESGFYQYFAQKTLTNTQNPWYNEFYQYYQKLNFTSSTITGDSIASHPLYKNNSVTPLLIDAVFLFAHALNDFLQGNCRKPIIWNSTARACEEQRNVFSAFELGKHLKNITFTSPTGNLLKLDANGNNQGKYRIVNYQKLGDEFYKLVDVGIWDMGQADPSRLQIDGNIQLQFGSDDGSNPRYQFQSKCNECTAGHIKNPQDLSCCGSCIACVGQNFTTLGNSSQCRICPAQSWGNNPLLGSNSCQILTEAYLHPSDAWGIVLMTFACLGLIAVAIVSVIVLIYWNTPIMKSSGREQMVMLLIGISLCFLSTAFFITKPSLPVCLLRRISLWLCLSLIICALFVKLVRIARIFLRKNLSQRPKFIEPIYQIIFTLLLVGIQMIFVVISLIVVHPDVERRVQLDSVNTNDVPILILSCQQPHTVIITLQLLFFSVILFISNALAMLTIRFPANFKEVKYVAFSTFSVAVIWIAFVVLYFSTRNEYQIATVSLAIQVSGFSVLVCMFAHRALIMVFQPGRNVPTHSTHLTSKAAPTNNSSAIQQKVTTTTGVEQH